MRKKEVLGFSFQRLSVKPFEFFLFPFFVLLHFFHPFLLLLLLLLQGLKLVPLFCLKRTNDE